MGQSRLKNPFSGRWRIISMSAWDEDYIDEEEEGFFEFAEKGSGEFHFGYVHGRMDCVLTTRDGKPAIERAVRTQEWKLILRDHPKDELYDLAHDPGERQGRREQNTLDEAAPGRRRDLRP